MYTYKNFLQDAKKAGASPLPFEIQFDTFFYHNNAPRARPATLSFYTEWISGGIEGNDCWEYKNLDIEPEAEPLDIENLTLFLQELCPNITNDQILSILNQDNIEEYSSDYDYYNNYVMYKVKFVYCKDVYKKLLELNLLPNVDIYDSLSM